MPTQATAHVTSHLTVMYLYARGGEIKECGAHLISGGGGGRGTESIPARPDSSSLLSRVHHRSLGGSPSLASLASGLRAAVCVVVSQ